MGPPPTPKRILLASVGVLVSPWVLIAVGCAIDVVIVSGIGAMLILPGAVAAVVISKWLSRDPLLGTSGPPRTIVRVIALFQGIIGFLFYCVGIVVSMN